MYKFPCVRRYNSGCVLAYVRAYVRACVHVCVCERERERERERVRERERERERGEERVLEQKRQIDSNMPNKGDNFLLKAGDICPCEHLSIIQNFGPEKLGQRVGIEDLDHDGLRPGWLGLRPG